MAAHGPDLRQKLCKRWEVEVAFKHSWPYTKVRIGAVQQRPDRIDHRCAMGVNDQVGGLTVVARDVEIGDATARQRLALRKATGSYW